MKEADAVAKRGALNARVQRNRHHSACARTGIPGRMERWEQRRKIGNRKSWHPAVRLWLLLPLLLPPVVASHDSSNGIGMTNNNSSDSNDSSISISSAAGIKSVIVRLSTQGLRELHVRAGDVLVLETSRPIRASSVFNVTRPSPRSLSLPAVLRLLQVTDGSWLVQTVRKGRIIKDCRVSRDPHDVRRFVEHFLRTVPAHADLGDARAAYVRMSSSHIAPGRRATDHRPATQRKFRRGVWMPLLSAHSHGRLATYLDVQRQVSECQDFLWTARLQLQALAQTSQESQEDDRESLQQTAPDRTSWRGKRDLLSGWLIFPGTKWCGDGDIAEDEKDLGYDEALDSCCREHDRCPHIIPRLTWHYKLFNYYLHTLLHCRCDRRFRKCLKSSPSPSAHMVGKIYFNVIGPQCFKFTKQKTCKRRNWWGRCKRYGYVKVAHPTAQKYF